MSTGIDLSQNLTMQDALGQLAALQQDKQLLEQKLYLESITARFTELMRWDETQTMQVWADRLLDALAGELGAVQAILYRVVPDAKRLEAIGGYACKSGTLGDVAFGESVIGQAAVNRHPVVLDVPGGLDGNLNENIAVITLRTFAVFPLIFNEKLEGMFVFTSPWAIDKAKQNIINVLLPVVAANLGHIATQVRIQHMLEEAREHAMQLSAQEEELRQNMEELTATQEEMQRLNAEMRSQIKAIHRSNAVIEFDLNGLILHANEKFLSLMGFTLPEVVGRHHSIFVSEEYKKSDEYAGFWRTLRNGEFLQGEFQRLAKHGRPVWIAGTYNPIMGPDGSVAKIMKFCWDVSDKHQSKQVPAIAAIPTATAPQPQTEAAAVLAVA